jgi:integrase
MVDAKKERWLGGPIRHGKRGPVFIIERWIDGRHWHVSTKCRTERAALKELERFEQSPADYRRQRGEKATGLVMTPELVNEYLEWMDEQKLSRPYIKEHERHLGEIMVAMDGRDLRRIGFVALRAVIDSFGAVAKWNRTKCIKAFASWLRRHKGALPRNEDPTLDLLNPVQTPEKHRRRKAMEPHVVEKAIALMTNPAIRDIAIVLQATGCHISEMLRFADGDGGLFEPADWQEGMGVLGNLLVRHKTDMRRKQTASHVVAITDPEVFDALKRIQARGKAPSRGAIQLSDNDVSAQLGVKFSMGWNRHTVATRLAKGGTAEREIANLLGQKTTNMAKQVYIDLGLSARPVPIPKLKLVKG